MIFDCFLFYNEFEILDIRLNELDPVVDYFVLVESTVTHTNKPKPLYYQENKTQFKKFNKKIIHVVVRDSPNVNLAWIINGYQFAQMIRGLKDAKPSDIVLFGDLDEIPKSSKILEWKDKPGKLKVFLQSLSFFYLNYFEYANPPWKGTHMTTYNHLLSMGSTWIGKYSPVDAYILDGGWHFSYIGDVNKITHKISIMTHQEYNTKQYNTRYKISRAIKEKKDLFDFNNKFKIVSANLLPEYVRENISKFKTMLAKEEKIRFTTWKF